MSFLTKLMGGSKRKAAVNAAADAQQIAKRA